jgi:hypothetical protein
LLLTEIQGISKTRLEEHAVLPDDSNEKIRKRNGKCAAEAAQKILFLTH